MKIFDAFVNASRAHSARRAGRGQLATTNADAASPPLAGASSSESTTASAAGQGSEWMVDLERRRDALTARVAELQWDLGGLVYEMAIRNRMRVDVLVKRAAALQDADAELSEVERIERVEQTGTAGVCGSCGAPHSSGAVYCWQCGRAMVEQVPSDAIAAR